MNSLNIPGGHHTSTTLSVMPETRGSTTLTIYSTALTIYSTTLTIFNSLITSHTRNLSPK